MNQTDLNRLALLRRLHKANGVYKMWAKSPITYVGGKSRAIGYILEKIPPNTDTIVSPFVGGASFEIVAASLGYKVICYDICQPLINFWQVCKNDK